MLLVSLVLFLPISAVRKVFKLDFSFGNDKETREYQDSGEQVSSFRKQNDIEREQDGDLTRKTNQIWKKTTTTHQVKVLSLYKTFGFISISITQQKAIRNMQKTNKQTQIMLPRESDVKVV